MIAFGSPWALAGLALLPALWWLIRRAPPAPRVARLPTIVLLPESATPPAPARRPPWWLAALRLGALALLALGLAGPTWRTEGEPPPERLALVIDNGWAAGAAWPVLQRAADRELAALPDTARVLLVPTTAAPGASPAAPPWRTPEAARVAVATLAAWPWPGDRAAAVRAVPAGVPMLWIADGREDAGAAALRAHGGRVVVPGVPGGAIVRAWREGGGWRFATAGAAPGAALIARDAAGRELARASTATGRLDIAPGGAPARLALDPSAGAAGVWLAAGATARPRVVIVDGERAGGAPPLERGAFFVRRALEPHAAVEVAGLDRAAAAAGALVVLVDVALPRGLPAAALDARVRAGGVVVAFAGPRSANARALDGDFALGRPLGLGGVAVDGPLAAMPRFTDFRVARQSLANAGPLRWAWLADGTPLVTARRLGAGLLVNVHTAAAPGWSTLPLTGALEALLVPLLPLAADPMRLDIAAARPWRLEAMLAADGALVPPPAPALLAPASIARVPLSAAAPPGLWRSGEAVAARNLGALIDVRRAPLSTTGMRVGPAGGAPRDLGAPLLAVGLLLLALDALLALGGRGAVLLGAAAFAAGAPAAAQTTLIGVVASGAPARDAAARAGLDALAATLAERTAVRASVSTVDPARAELGRFALIYWPVVSARPAAGGARVRAYLEAGGLVVFDELAPRAAAGALAGLGLPPIEPLRPAHVLGRAFYLVAPPAGTWIEADTAGANGRVAGVVLGRADWAAAWARGDEAARRFGVNLVLYALTGTYKADQVHARALIERGAPGP